MEGQRIDDVTNRFGFNIFDIGKITNKLERSRFYYRITKAINQDPELADVLLPELMMRFRTIEDCYLIALCFRLGVSPNVYIREGDDIYEKHILVYFLEILNKRWNSQLILMTPEQFQNLIPFIIVLMVELGTSLVLPSYRLAKKQVVDPKLLGAASKMQELNNEKYKRLDIYISGLGINMEPGASDKIVIQENRNSIGIFREERNVSLMSLKNILTENQWKSVLLLCNKPEEVDDDFLANSFQMEDILLARASDIFRRQPLSFKTKNEHFGVFTKIYYECISACDIDMFRDCLDNSVHINYFDINFILQRMLDENNKDLVEDYMAFLRLVAGHGIDLDINQMNSLSKVKNSDRFKEQIEIIYAQPYFDKIKNSRKGLIPKRLQELCFALQISLEKSKGEILDSLQKIYDTDVRQVADSFRQRYYFRISSLFTPFLDFNKPSIPVIKLENLQFLTKPPELVNDYQTIVLEGDDGLFYAFNSDYFEALLQDDNLINSTLTDEKIKLPELTRLEIETRLKILKIYSINPNNVKTVIDAYNEMKSPDIITNERTNVVVESAKLSLIKDGISIESMLKKKNDDLDRFMRDTFLIMAPIKKGDITYYVPTKYLDNTHRWASFYRLVYHTLMHYPERYQKLVSYILSNTR